MEIIAVITIPISWSLITFTTDYERKFEDVISPDQIRKGRSIIHSIVTLPLLFISLMFLFRYAFGDVGVAIIFSLQLLVLLLYVIHFIYWRSQYKAAKAESLDQAKEYFEQFPWGEVEHAYGVATDSPDFLMELIIDHQDEDHRENAVNDFLYARPFHQWDVYSSTPYAIQCVLYIIKNVDVSHLKTIDGSLIYNLFHFINICIHGAKRSEALKKVIINDEPLYQSFVNHPDKLVREQVAELLSFCEEQQRKADDGISQG